MTNWSKKKNKKNFIIIAQGVISCIPSVKVVKCPQVHWVASLKNGADQELITQSITFIGQFLWYSTVTDDNFNSNVLSHKSGGLCGYFKKGLNNIILPINFRLTKHEQFTKHIISLWFKQLHGQSTVNHHFFL